jgi:hypothetical protein
VEGVDARAWWFLFYEKDKVDFGEAKVCCDQNRELIKHSEQ